MDLALHVALVWSVLAVATAVGLSLLGSGAKRIEGAARAAGRVIIPTPRTEAELRELTSV